MLESFVKIVVTNRKIPCQHAYCGVEYATRHRQRHTNIECIWCAHIFYIQFTTSTSTLLETPYIRL